jgi:ABC-type uncharacterized transport system permease subunit
MPRLCFALAFHAYAFGALAYLALLAQRWKGLGWVARGLTLAGWVLHGVGLAILLQGQHWMPKGFGEVASLLAFLLVAVFLAVDLRTRAAVLGAFLSPAAVAVLIPSLYMGPHGADLANPLRQPLLPVHIAVALAGLAVFGVATAVAGVYLLAEHAVKGKRFGTFFRKVPSLELLDDLNKRLVAWGFIALSLTLLTGAWVAARLRPGDRWDPAQLAIVVAWIAFGVLLQARTFAGWRGRRVALLTMAGFGVLVVSFVTRYGPWVSR